MRRRLTAAFVLLTVCLLLGAGVARTFAMGDLVREQGTSQVREQSVLLAEVVTERRAAGRAVDRAFLSGLVGAESRITWVPGPGSDARGVVVRGRGFTAGSGRGISASSPAAGGTVTVTQSRQVVQDVLGRDLWSLVVLYLIIAVTAGLVGYAVARALSAPFRRLADAAAALGRGRFDLELPRTRVPEARAIAQALRTSAGQLEGRLRRERDFAEQASHLLRTPLTGLRLELEDLTLRDDVPADARAAAGRGLAAVDAVDAVAGELVQLSRSASLVEGAEVSLVDLATQVAQRWADRLAVRDRVLSASAEGDLTLTFTPGPVEHVLDLVVAEVAGRRDGAVRLDFEGDPRGHLRVRVSADGASTPAPGRGRVAASGLDEARTVVESLGGRIRGEDPGGGLEVLLPRR